MMFYMYSSGIQSPRTTTHVAKAHRVRANEKQNWRELCFRAWFIDPTLLQLWNKTTKVLQPVIECRYNTYISCIDRSVVLQIYIPLLSFAILSSLMLPRRILSLIAVRVSRVSCRNSPIACAQSGSHAKAAASLVANKASYTLVACSRGLVAVATTGGARLRWPRSSQSPSQALRSQPPSLPTPHPPILATNQSSSYTLIW